MDLMAERAGKSRVTGAGEQETAAALPKLDLCVMNPPFTRSVGDNLLFGSRPLAERKRDAEKTCPAFAANQQWPERFQSQFDGGLGQRVCGRRRPLC